MEENIKKVWEKIYQEWFDLKKDFSEIKISEKYKPEKHFAIIVAQELTIDDIIVGIRKNFNLGLYNESLGSLVIKNERTSKDGDYIVFFNKNIEADEEFKDFSAKELQEINHHGITLIERLLLEVLYFNETKKHLDINNITLCTASRGPNNRVFIAHYISICNEFRVSWFDLDNYGEYLRSRALIKF